MRALKLDYRDAGRNSSLGIMLLVAGICIMLFVAWRYQALSQAVAVQELQLDKLEKTAASRIKTLPARKDGEEMMREIRQANEIIYELNLPWKELFEAFEVTRNTDIAVLAIEPDAQKGLVRISGEAKSLENLPAYFAYLEKVPLFRDVVLLNHQVQEQDPQHPVRFMVQAKWGALK